MDDQGRINLRMASGEPFTYADLCGLMVDKADQGRIADRTIQKWRRRGWIVFTREGRKVVWRLTDTAHLSLTVGGQAVAVSEH